MDYKVSKTKYKLKKVNRILDNVHGNIELTNVENKIEQLPIFKRLINISQLGIVNRIFPGAVHNRYSHSLGVMYVCDLMMKSINDKHDEEVFTACERQILRLAALLHDIGHYPLSHNIESVYKNRQKFETIEKAAVEENVEDITSCPNELIFAGQAQYGKYINNYEGTLRKDCHHEKIGYNIILKNESIRQCIKDNFVLINDDGTNDTSDSSKCLNPFFAEKSDKMIYTEEDINNIIDAVLNDIANIVIGNYSYESKFCQKYSAMIQLMHSELDADKIDYLLRDATFSGTTYGVMDFKVLVGCLDYAQIEFTRPEYKASKMKYIIGIRPKGIGSAEQFLINRYLSYKQVVHSKYVSILESMVSLIAKETIALKEYKSEDIIRYSQSPDTEDAFLSFTDNYIFSKFSTITDGRNPNKNILKNLSKNRAFDVIGEEICTDIEKAKCIALMKKKSLFKKFKKDYDKVSKIEYGQLNPKQRTILFSYKFEKFALTNQISIKEFKKNVRTDDKLYEIYDFYRLADGIPILGDNTFIQHDGSKDAIDGLPKLIVDVDSSFLHNISGLSYYILRRYNIDKVV